MELKLRQTKESDPDYVFDAEHNEENSRFVIPWPREKHVPALADPDIAHLIVQKQTIVSYESQPLFGGRASPQEITTAIVFFLSGVRPNE